MSNMRKLTLLFIVTIIPSTGEQPERDILKNHFYPDNSTTMSSITIPKPGKYTVKTPIKAIAKNRRGSVIGIYRLLFFGSVA